MQSKQNYARGGERFQNRTNKTQKPPVYNFYEADDSDVTCRGPSDRHVALFQNPGLFFFNFLLFFFLRAKRNSAAATSLQVDAVSEYTVRFALGGGLRGLGRFFRKWGKKVPK